MGRNDKESIPDSWEKIATIKLLFALMKQYDTGYVEGEANKWVFTCKYGWIDLGHFFTTALASYLSNEQISNDLSIGLEIGQNFLLWNENYEWVPGTDITDGQSAYTFEDLNSNYQGANFEHGGIGNIKSNFEQFLIDAGAVNHVKEDVVDVREKLAKDVSSLLNGDIYTGKRFKTKEDQLKYQKEVFKETFCLLCVGDKPKEQYK